MDEHSIVSQVLSAQTDRQAADQLIEQYMPFIRSEAARTMGRFPTDADDELSIAMFAFYEAMMAYRPGKGAFLKLASLAIKNRLIDHYRKEQRHRGQLSLDTPQNEQGDTLAHFLSDPAADTGRDLERSAAQQEIFHFTQELEAFGISLTEVAENCPRQDRTLRACMKVLAYARENPELLCQLTATGRLPAAQLCQGSGVDKKILERHRKYIVAILLAYTNGFEIIRGHLRQIKGKGGRGQ